MLFLADIEVKMLSTFANFADSVTRSLHTLDTLLDFVAGERYLSGYLELTEDLASFCSSDTALAAFSSC